MSDVNTQLALLCAFLALLCLLLLVRVQRLEAEPRLELRDYFAAEAMNGELACQHSGYEWGTSEKLSAKSYAIADAMMKARVA